MTELSRLRWQCRRGIKEMDLILERFLEQCYPSLSPQQRIAFNQILDETDLDIMDWILDRSRPENKDYELIIHFFREVKPG